MFKPSAKIIADSINPSGERLTTFVATFHRFILPEILTHRVWSRNTSSSRAIPAKKLIEKVKAEEVYPLHWGQNCKGMSAKQEVEDPTRAFDNWTRAKECAIHYAEQLVANGIHKQVVNRLLEPFSTTTMIITATEYKNFFMQRCHPDAQPEIQALAIAMMEAYQKSKPKKLDWEQWHIPFSDDLQDETICMALQIATGRCARVSYLNHDGTRDHKKDVELHDRLLTARPPHLSPFEHCAKAKPGKWANLDGFRSYRNQLEAGNVVAQNTICNQVNLSGLEFEI